MALLREAIAVTPCDMHPSCPILKASGHSKRWLQRQSQDPYVRQRVEFRSRSAFKLLEIDKKHPFLLASQPRVIVDLGAAPGGWSQVVALKLSTLEAHAKPRIIALDLNPIKPIPGVMTLQTDFLSASGTRLLSSHIPPDENGQRKVDIILSDIAANATGNATSDHANSLRISEAVFEFAVHHLDIGGSLWYVPRLISPSFP